MSDNPTRDERIRKLELLGPGHIEAIRQKLRRIVSEQSSVEYWQARYLAAAHGMQTGVAYELEKDPSSGTPKHLRVGVNSAMVEHAALIHLLVDKKIIGALEYRRAIAEGMENERDVYQDRLSQQFGANITLG